MKNVLDLALDAGMGVCKTQVGDQTIVSVTGNEEDLNKLVTLVIKQCEDVIENSLIDPYITPGWLLNQFDK